MQSISEERPQESLETKIGLYWLHKLGIASLVFGFVFLLMYSFQFWGPPVKVLAGFAAAAVLVVLGEIMGKNANSRWFGQGLSTGGWALGYFTAYAAYYIPEARVITSCALDTVLLSVIAAGSLLSALRVRSELLSIFSIALATTSILLSGPGLFSNISILIISASAAVLANRRSWQTLFAVALIACYGSHFYCSGQIAAANIGAISTTTVFLALIWLAFSIGTAFTFHDKKETDNFTIICCANACALAAGLAIFSARAIPHTTEVVLAMAGFAYQGMAKWLRDHEREQLSTTHALLGLVLLNGATFMRYSATTLLAVVLMQVVILAVLGAKYDIRAFRWFAALLGILFVPLWLLGSFVHAEPGFGLNCIEYMPIAGIAVVAFGAICVFHRQLRNVSQYAPDLIKRYSDLYYLGANIMALLCIVQVIDPSQRCVAWALLAVVNHALSLKTDDALFFVVGSIGFLISSAQTIFARPHWDLLCIAIVTAQYYAAYIVATTVESWQASELAFQLKVVYASAGSILLTLLLFAKMPSDYVSLSIGVQGILLVSAGFIMRDSLLRLFGLATLAVLVAKLLCVDAANFGTLERIISFIGAGVVFLLSSYVYARFTRAFESRIQPGETEEPQPV